MLVTPDVWRTWMKVRFDFSKCRFESRFKTGFFNLQVPIFEVFGTSSGNCLILSINSMADGPNLKKKVGLD